MKLDLERVYEAVTATGESAKMKLGELLSFSDKTLLYFYPKDNTPGCSLENKDFSRLKKDFQDLGITTIGVSKDSTDSHKSFIKKQELDVDLISDPELVLHNQLETYGEKKNYGKIYMGVIRSTFLLDREGNILEQWRNIRATGHAERILKQLKD